MADYPRYYAILCDAVSEALMEMDNQNYGLATSILIKGLREAEDCCLILPEDEY